jgi:hypothetical protein
LVWLRSDLDDRLLSHLLSDRLDRRLRRSLSDRLDRRLRRSLSDRLTRLLDDALSGRLSSDCFLVHFHIVFDLERVVFDAGCEERVCTHSQRLHGGPDRPDSLPFLALDHFHFLLAKGVRVVLASCVGVLSLIRRIWKSAILRAALQIGLDLRQGRR